MRRDKNQRELWDEAPAPLESEASPTIVRNTNWRPPEVLPELKDVPEVGFDLEWQGKNPFENRPIGVSVCLPIGVDFRAWPRYYLPFGHRGGGNLDENVVRRWCQTELRGRDLVGLNIKSDAHVARRWGCDLAELGCRLHDVAFPAALLNENRRSGFSLGALAKEYLLEDERKVIPGTVAPEDFYITAAGDVAERAEQDAYLALRIRHVTNPLIDAEDLRRVLDLEDSVIVATAEMEFNGARLDRPKLERWCKEATERQERLSLDLYHDLGFMINPDSQIGMQQLFDHLKLPYPEVIEHDGTRRQTFEEESLGKVDDPLVKKALVLRKVKSIRSKFLEKYLRALDGNNILRYQLHQLRGDEYGTVMGRYSSAAPSSGGANIQQVPKVDKQLSDGYITDWIIRELFIPDDGFLWLKADAAQIEYRILAHYAKNVEIMRRYAEDPHVSFHRIVEQMIHRIKPDYPYWAVKNLNFAKVYGGGRDKIAMMLGVTRSVSDPLVDDYEEMFPEATHMMRRAAKLAQTRGYVHTFLGRRRRYPTADRTHSALHSVIAGTAADVNKLKLREVYDARKELGIHKMRLTVHDEMDADVTDDPTAHAKIRELFDQQAVPLDVPILWEVKTGMNWRCKDA